MISARKCVIQSAGENMALATGMTVHFVLGSLKNIVSSGSVILV